MLNKLTTGQWVIVASLGHRGVITSVQNDGLFGTLRTAGGSRFTVIAGECREDSLGPVDELDRMLEEIELPGLEWKQPESKATRHSVSNYVAPMLAAERGGR